MVQQRVANQRGGVVQRVLSAGVIAVDGLDGLEQQLALVRARIHGIVEFAHQRAQRRVQLSRGEEGGRAHAEGRRGEEEQQHLHNAPVLRQDVLLAVDGQIFQIAHDARPAAHHHAHVLDIARVFPGGQRGQPLVGGRAEHRAVQKQAGGAVGNGQIAADFLHQRVVLQRHDQRPHGAVVGVEGLQQHEVGGGVAALPVGRRRILVQLEGQQTQLKGIYAAQQAGKLGHVADIAIVEIGVQLRHARGGQQIILSI